MEKSSSEVTKQERPYYGKKGLDFFKIRQKLEKYLNFRISELAAFESFVRLLHRPQDPSSLATLRILFGFLMIIDVHLERGLSSADTRWGDPRDCRFPYFSFLKPLPLEWMCAIYFVMLLGATGVMLGWRFRASCLCFIVPYWYIFLMDKTRWNNHSYLFGLITTHLMLSGADRCWSLDGRRKPWIQNTDVPLWNYILIRGQIFLVYFIAGLKKTEDDWITGHSMGDLGIHWVFDGFRLFLDDDQITYFIVHLGGFLLDLTVGFFMVLKFSRPYAYVFCAAFNLMNSRMFSIGMFPYVMIAVMPIFSDAAWPKRILRKCPKFLQQITLYSCSVRRNVTCVYESKANVEIHKEKILEKKKVPGFAENLDYRQKLTAVFLCIFFAIQGFLPYSHWLTKGYNTWTLGAYGYSWDMMIHRWNYLHTSISVVEKKNGRQYFLNPKIWTNNQRWVAHADMVKQYAYCVEQRLKDEYNITDIEIFVDAWVSLNGRFTQRVFDPTVDILTAEWSPFREVTWVLPLQIDLSDWRYKLYDLENMIVNETMLMNVIFITDFPGFQLINYVDKDIANTTLQVLKGYVEVESPLEQLSNLEEGQSIQIPSGQFHRVTPLHHKRACYMYSFVNKTHVDLETAWNKKMSSNNPLSSESDIDNRTSQYFKLKEEEEEQKRRAISWYPSREKLDRKFQHFHRSMTLLAKAFYSILSGQPMSIEKMT